MSHLERIISEDNGLCFMQVVFADIVNYSEKRPTEQYNSIQILYNIIRGAFRETAREYIEHLRTRHAHIPNDTVLQTIGDGIAVGFPFQGEPTMALFFYP